MISASKSGYARRHPDRAPVFNANLCTLSGKVWEGDLDLTLDERALIDIAECLEEPLFVLHEHDGSFENERNPRLESAAYAVIAVAGRPTRSLYDRRTYHRAKDGTLRRIVPPAPRLHMITPDGWDGSQRWRLLRFWRLDLRRTRNRECGGSSGFLLYVGRRSDHNSPLLVLSCHRGGWPRAAARIEVTWYSSRRPYRSDGGRRRVLELPLGRYQLTLIASRWANYMSELRIHLEVKPRSRHEASEEGGDDE